MFNIRGCCKSIKLATIFLCLVAGSNATAVLTKDWKVNKIEIIFDSDKEINISEIVVLGK